MKCFKTRSLALCVLSLMMQGCEEARRAAQPDSDVSRDVGTTGRPRTSVGQRRNENGHESAQKLLYLYSRGCPDCEEVARDVLPVVQERGIDVQKLDVATSEGFERIQEVETQFGVQFTVLAPIMVFEDVLLKNSGEIREFFLH